MRLCKLDFIQKWGGSAVDGLLALILCRKIDAQRHGVNKKKESVFFMYKSGRN